MRSIRTVFRHVVMPSIGSAVQLFRDGHRWMQRLSFDSPLIAVSWHLLFSPPANPRRRRQAVVLGLSVWGIYLLDRYLDVRAGSAAPHSERHQLFRSAPKAGVALTIAANLSALAAAHRLLRPVAVRSGAALGAAIAIYLVGVNRGWPAVRITKETLVGLGFAAGTYLPTFVWAPDRLHSGLPGFAAVCLVNAHLCDWVDRKRRLAALARAALIAAALSAGDRSAPARGALISSLLLALVAIAPIRGATARSAADLALLTPLLPLRRTL